MGYSPAQKGAIDLAKRSLVDSIYTSCKVEGLSTTFPDTQNILDNAPVTTTADVVVFTLNMRDAWRFLLDNLDYPINLMYIRELNKICGNRLIYGSGELRTSNVRIGGSSYIPQIPTQEEVIRKLNELNTTTDPVERAVKTFCYLAKAQLFIDGNKRLAQLVANKILISEGIGILQINDADRFKQILVDYYESTSDRLKDFLKECIIRSSPVEFIVHDGVEYAVQDIISELPFSVRSQYQTDKECAMDFIEVYLVGKQC